MPYIKTEQREQLKTRGAENAGELNYSLTRVCIDYIISMGLNYAHINDVLGALEGCKQEFYRRMVVDYENDKQHKNGDVYS